MLCGLPMPMNPNATNLEAKLLPPSATHWLGTDNLGRDVLSRMVAGSTISLTVGFVAMAVSLGIGIFVGAVSGYFGGWIDNLLMRIVDALLCFPSFFLILTAIAILGPNIWIIIAVIGLVSWTGTARLVRAEFLTLRESEYVRAARAMGQSGWNIIFRHIMPNAAAPIFVTAIISIPDAILVESVDNLDSFSIAKALKGAIDKSGKKADLILTGKQAIDDDCLQVPQILAEMLKLPSVSVIVGFELAGTTVKVKREVEGGALEVYEINGPVVLAANKGLNTPRYASLPGIMKAKKKPLAKFSLGDVGVSDADRRVKYSGFKLPPEKPAGKKFDATDAAKQKDVVAQVVGLLRTEAKVL
jgi:ABC-type microcin C transport system permease subunit YejE